MLRLSGKKSPLTCKQVKKGLKRLGFEARPQKGTSHEHWIKDVDGRRYKVTVDCPKARQWSVGARARSGSLGSDGNLFNPFW